MNWKTDEYETAYVKHLFCVRDGRKYGYYFQVRNFAIGSWNLQAAHYEYLNQTAAPCIEKALASPMREGGQAIAIRGSSSGTGPTSTNRKISERRVDSVLGFLRAKMRIVVPVYRTVFIWNEPENRTKLNGRAGSVELPAKVAFPVEDPGERMVELICGFPAGFQADSHL